MGIHTKLDALYDRVPRIACKGLCTADCGEISMSRVEARRLQQKTGTWPIFDVARQRCGYLQDERCSIYRWRPLICRVYGVHEEMPCPFGCVPERVLSEPEYVRLYEMREAIVGTARYDARSQ